MSRPATVATTMRSDTPSAKPPDSRIVADSTMRRGPMPINRMRTAVWTLRSGTRANQQDPPPPQYPAEHHGESDGKRGCIWNKPGDGDTTTVAGYGR